MGIYSVSGEEINAAYGVDGAPLDSVFDESGNKIVIAPEPEPTFLDTAVLTALLPCTTPNGTQGACTDGEYIYQASGDTSTYTYLRIIKYKISDGTSTYVQFNGTPNFGHANDMAYNPNNGYLYIPTMLSDGSVIVLDSKDLSYVTTLTITTNGVNPFTCWQLCFDRLTNHFYSAGREVFFVYDQDLNYLYSISHTGRLETTDQGATTDGVYYYRATYNPNYIDVIRLSTGERVKTITNPMSGEPESIMYDWNGNFYMSKNTTGEVFYRAQLFEEA